MEKKYKGMECYNVDWLFVDAEKGQFVYDYVIIFNIPMQQI